MKSAREARFFGQYCTVQRKTQETTTRENNARGQCQGPAGGSVCHLSYLPGNGSHGGNDAGHTTNSRPTSPTGLFQQKTAERPINSHHPTSRAPNNVLEHILTRRCASLAPHTGALPLLPTSSVNSLHSTETQNTHGVPF